MQAGNFVRFRSPEGQGRTPYVHAGNFVSGRWQVGHKSICPLIIKHLNCLIEKGEACTTLGRNMNAKGKPGFAAGKLIVPCRRRMMENSGAAHTCGMNLFWIASLYEPVHRPETDTCTRRPGPFQPPGQR